MHACLTTVKSVTAHAQLTSCTFSGAAPESMPQGTPASQRPCLLQRMKEQLPQLKEALEDRGLRGVVVQCPYTKRMQGETFGEQLQHLAG